MKKSALYSLVFTIFNDGLGWGVVLTLFAPLLMNSTSHFLPEGASLDMQNVVLGLLIGCYPLTQFLFMPLLGALSDHIGRKKVLEWTILCAGFSFILTAVAISNGSLWMLFVSRILAGIFSANAATAQAAIADISSDREKAKNLSLTGIAGGLSWVVGPPLGGFLSTSQYFSWATFSTPIWIVAGIFFINYVWVAKSFEETYVRKTSGKKHDLKQDLKDIVRLSKIPTMSAWLWITLLFYFGWGFFVLFYPALLIQRFQFDQSHIGMLSGYLSVFWLICSTMLNRGLAERYKPQAFVLLCLPIAGLIAMVLAFTISIDWWYLTFPFMAICGAAVWINILALISNLAGKDNQGKVFGVSQSLMSLAMFVSPILSGTLAAFDNRIPMAIGGVVLLTAGAFASLYYFKRRRSHES
jgi:DHA1 family tetracycline resistance protein-like MFS transporter